MGATKKSPAMSVILLSTFHIIGFLKPGNNHQGLISSKALPNVPVPQKEFEEVDSQL